MASLQAGGTLLALAITCVLASSAAAADNGLQAAIVASKPIVDVRMRYENVDQDPLAKDAEASTLRIRAGFETGKWLQTSLLAEGESVIPLQDDFNSTTNGKTQYPVVADRENHEVNRLQLTNTALPQTTLTLGRQRILLDDQRFVGNVGWRQNEQTFDALRVVNKTIKNLTVDASYLNQVNRVFGKDSPQGRYEGDSYLANVSYQFPFGKLTGFGYFLEFDPIAAVPAAVRDSSKTYGVRFAGEKPLAKAKLA
ncbi:MAG: alginate export family protein, partial [Steroidobacteraceae bacterium]